MEGILNSTREGRDRTMAVCFDDRFPLRISSGGENGTIYSAQFSIETQTCIALHFHLTKLQANSPNRFHTSLTKGQKILTLPKSPRKLNSPVANW